MEIFKKFHFFQNHLNVIPALRVLNIELYCAVPYQNTAHLPPGVTACQPIPWLGGDNRIPEDQHLWGGAAWPSGFAASQGTPS